MSITASLLDEEPIMTVICHEKHGDVERTVRPMILTMENLRRFWEEARQYKSLFTEEINGDFGAFLNVFLITSPDSKSIIPRGLFWVIDDFVGVFYITDIVLGHDAQVHYSFFDRKHRGRQELAKALLKWAFDKYKFRRLSTTIPTYATKAANGFAESLGFVREGKKRRAARYQGRWFDVILYGILAEEANGSSD